MESAETKSWFDFFAKLMAGIAVVAFLYSQLQRLNYSPDDTYIYLKYAQNIASGNNFSFNQGQPSYGVTGPLWAVILSVPFILGIDPFFFAKFADLFFILCSFVLFYRIASILFYRNNFLPLAGTVIFILNPWVIRSTFTGMETSMALFAVLAAFYLYYIKRYYLLFLMAGISILLRPETLVLYMIFIFVISLNLRKEKNPSAVLNTFKYASVTLLIIVPFWIFAYLTFGTILPNTSLGKAVMSKDIFFIWEQTKAINRVFILFAPAEVLLGAVGIFFMFINKKIAKYLPVIMWTAGLLVLYMVTTAAVMSRYFLIIYPPVILLLLETVQSIKFRPKLAAAALVIVLLVYSQVVFYKYVKPYSDNFTEGINQCLMPAGKWLHDNTPPGSRVLVNDVGVIGFYADRYLIDAAALINRDRNLNKKIMSVSNTEKEYPHLMLNFIETDYLIEKDTIANVPLKTAYNYELEPLSKFVFRQMWVFDPNPKYFTIYKVKKIPQ
jgi:hypothetical protein